jgi:DNA modification methylase
MRLKACKEAGLKEVPVIKAEDLTEDQQKEFIIKDNVGFGEWDWADLANNWDAEELTEWGLDLPTDSFIEMEAVEDDFEASEDGIETDIVLGDLIEIGEHRLLCGDSTDSDQVARLMDGEKADMVFTDPPYGGGVSGNGGFPNDAKMRKLSKKNIDAIESIYNFDTKNFLSVLPLFVKDKISIYIFHNQKLLPDYLNYAIELNKGFDILAWHKKSFIPMSGAHYFSDTEWLIKIRDKGSKFNSGQSECNYGRYWLFDSENKGKAENKDHPTIKPIKILSDCIKISSDKDDLILDFFLGSGSTMVASHQLNRKCYGIELEPKYCQVIIDRMKKLDPSLTIKINGVCQAEKN